MPRWLKSWGFARISFREPAQTHSRITSTLYTHCGKGKKGDEGRDGGEEPAQHPDLLSVAQLLYATDVVVGTGLRVASVIPSKIKKAAEDKSEYTIPKEKGKATLPAPPAAAEDITGGGPSWASVLGGCFNDWSWVVGKGSDEGGPRVSPTFDPSGHDFDSGDGWLSDDDDDDDDEEHVEPGQQPSKVAVAKALQEPILRHVWEYLAGEGCGKLEQLADSCFKPPGYKSGEDRSRQVPLEAAQKAHLQKVKNEIKDGTYKTWDSLTRAAPIPIFSRNEKNELCPGACASRYCIEPVCLW